MGKGKFLEAAEDFGEMGNGGDLEVADEHSLGKVGGGEVDCLKMAFFGNF